MEWDITACRWSILACTMRSMASGNHKQPDHNEERCADAEQRGRLTQNQGRNGYPACSPDGRLVAFFSTRTSGEGPGLYVMRLDGGRPKRISTLVGDSLRWDPLPPGRGVEMKN